MNTTTDTPATLLQLAERVERENPGRELDAEIARAAGWERHPESAAFTQWWAPPGSKSWDDWQPYPPQFMKSLDMAVMLIPPEANCHGYESDPSGVEAFCSRNMVASGHWYFTAHASTPAAALAAAALRARARG